MLSNYKGWILEAIVRESAAACSVPINLIFIPNSKKSYFRIKDLIVYLCNRKPIGPYLFVNQNTFFKALKKPNIEITPAQANIFYTHLTEENLSELEQSKILGTCRRIYTNNSLDRTRLIKHGLDERKIEVVYGGINRKIYFPNTYTLDEIYVLITGDCKERKRPNLIFEIIHKMQNINFIIHGRGWNDYCKSENIRPPKNLKILKFKLENNPKLMRNASAYLSLSKLEGGPYTTIEALASGTPVVVTSTGWNKEIVNAQNGVLLPIEANVDQIIAAIGKTVLLKDKVKHRDLIRGRFTWEQLGKAIYN
jgi:glycosyltransferase involved in cell wall biosynthesis